MFFCMCAGGYLLIRTTHPSARRPSTFGNSSILLSQHSRKVGATASSIDSQTRVVNSYGRLPLSFEANKGQTDSQVKFLLRGSGYMVFLTRRGEAVLVLRKPPKRDPSLHTTNGAALEPDLTSAAPSTVVRMTLVGARIAPRVEGVQEQPGKANYFVGNNSKKWRANVPMFAKVRYRNIYPGVDLEYYGNPSGGLENDFIVAPGADPHSIVLNFARIDNLSLDSQGGLVLAVKGGEVRFSKPRFYQAIGAAHREILGSYVLEGTEHASFQVADYDPTKPLIIDPTLFYSTYLGGSGNDQGVGIAVDAAGNAYVSGTTVSIDFPTTSGGFQTTFGGIADVFIAKLNSTGSGLVYSTYLGGSGNDQGVGIAVDAAGNAYVTGKTQSTDFPTTPAAFQATFGSGFARAFVTKLNPTGSALLYSTYLGGTNDDEGRDIALDSLPIPNAFVTGLTNSGNFPTTAGAFQTALAGGTDAFVTKITNIIMPPPPTVGKVTGGGVVDVSGGFANFGFIVQRQASDGSIHGDLQYVNHASGAKIHSEMFTTFLIAGDTATFGGTCTNNGAPGTFNVNVTDNDQSGGSDSFTISIDGGPPEGGALRDGDIEIHNQ